MSPNVVVAVMCEPRVSAGGGRSPVGYRESGDGSAKTSMDTVEARGLDAVVRIAGRS
jgi:hypothetical protein